MILMNMLEKHQVQQHRKLNADIRFVDSSNLMEMIKVLCLQY